MRGMGRSTPVSAGSGADREYSGIYRFPATADVIHNPVTLLPVEAECPEIGQLGVEGTTWWQSVPYGVPFQDPPLFQGGADAWTEAIGVYPPAIHEPLQRGGEVPEGTPGRAVDIDRTIAIIRDTDMHRLP